MAALPASVARSEVAQYLWCDQSLYSKYERGLRPLPLDLAVELARFYGVSLAYLVGLTDVKAPYPPTQGTR